MDKTPVEKRHLRRPRLNWKDCVKREAKMVERSNQRKKISL